MYRGGDTALVSPEWVETHANTAHGPLGALYPNYDGGDIWSGKLGRVRGIKEGDTPSFLFLFPNGLNRPDRPESGGWGGRMTPEDPRRLRWIDIADPDAPPADPDPRMSAVHRWRPDFQNEMQARLDWCVKGPKEANHPPIARLRGGAANLDATRSTDPDGDRLEFDWSIYPPVADVRVEPTAPGKARLIVPLNVPLPESIPVVVRVRDTGSPVLTRYARLDVTLRAKLKP